MVDRKDPSNYDGDRRDSSSMATAAAARLQTDSVEIPNKLYFRIGDVSRITGIKAYVLRFWENEFPSLNPKKSGTNQRLYKRKDVELVLEIKHLLYEKRYTIEGARSFLQQNKGKAQKTAEKAPPPKQAALFPEPPQTHSGKLNAIKQELHSLLELLS
jgi:DNA-binding transcriptional MerR regulator